MSGQNWGVVGVGVSKKHTPRGLGGRIGRHIGWVRLREAQWGRVMEVLEVVSPAILFAMVVCGSRNQSDCPANASITWTLIGQLRLVFEAFLRQLMSMHSC